MLNILCIFVNVNIKNHFFNNFYSYLKQIFTLEECAAKIINKYEIFLGKWNVIFHDLKN